MKRRTFINTSALAGLGLTVGASARSANQDSPPEYRGAFSLDDNRVAVYTPATVAPLKLFHITDTHLALDDGRGAPYREYSGRMAAAYTSNSHFKTGASYSAEESFEMTLETAKKARVDFLALTGDIFSFPSEAAVEWVCRKLDETGIPFAYIAGNHDWHYEGMPGRAQALRDKWTAARLTPMYQGHHPLQAAYDVHGIRVVCIDNSTYEILPEQRDFFRAQTQMAVPLLLLMHIPIHMPGRSMGHGCGHLDWGEKTDRNFEIERREKWRATGHTQTTMDFCREVFEAPNLLAVLTGHTHRQSLDLKNGIPQVVSRDNACGYYGELTIRTFG